MRRKPNYDRESATLLASAGVLAMGLLGVMFIVASSFSDPLVPMLVSIAIFIGLFLSFLLSLRSQPGPGGNISLKAWFKSRRAEPKAPNYSPRRVRTSRGTSTSGNEPPSAEDVRDMKETSANAWVPSSVPKDSR